MQVARRNLHHLARPNQLMERPWAGRVARAPPPLHLRLGRQPLCCLRLCRLRLCRLRCRLLGLQRRLHGAGQTEQARLWVRLLGRKAQLAVHVATPSVDFPLQGERQRVRSASRDVAGRGQFDRREERRVYSVDEPLLPRHERRGIERLHRPADGRGEGRHVSSADLAGLVAAKREQLADICNQCMVCRGDGARSGVRLGNKGGVAQPACGSAFWR
mmetsp:Transcript_20568/g.65778  ORF Transcript_20568/g.65778 Transcript_20568/m.65778 type:complete len:216 (-) Transcript_20568:392-1039(-)